MRVCEVLKRNISFDCYCFGHIPIPDVELLILHIFHLLANTMLANDLPIGIGVDVIDAADTVLG